MSISRFFIYDRDPLLKRARIRRLLNIAEARMIELSANR